MIYYELPGGGESSQSPLPTKAYLIYRWDIIPYTIGFSKDVKAVFKLRGLVQ